MPQSGWTLVSSDDLGELCGNCELCDEDLRYVYLISHPTWGFMAVGTDCCDRLTETEEANAILAETKKRNQRRKNFLSSKKWKSCESGNISIRKSGRLICIALLNGHYRITMGDAEGKIEYETQLDAQVRAFEFFDSGDYLEFFAKRREAKERKKRAALKSSPGTSGVGTSRRAGG